MRARLRSITLRRVVAVVALAFFFLPLALRGVGMTARPFENRPMALFPKLSQGWDGLEQAKQFFVDRMPLREQAVRADAWISTDIFDTSPTAGRAGTKGPAGLQTRPPPKQEPAAAPAAPAAVDKAITGKAGWLYLEGEFLRACVPSIPWRQTMRRWQRMAQIIRRSGRRVVVAIPPDKSTIHPEYLPETFTQRACLGPGHRTAWEAIDAATDPAVLGLRRAMLAAKRPGSAGAYYRQDTHWNTIGGTLAVGAILEHLGGGVRMRPSEIVKSRERHQGDLTVLNGDPQFENAPRWTIRRAAGAPRLGGRTLFVHDSYGGLMVDALVPYADTPVIVQWFNTPAADLIAEIARADTVILETVEREMTFRASDAGLLSAKFLEQLRRGLPRRAG